MNAALEFVKKHDRDILDIDSLELLEEGLAQALSEALNTAIAEQTWTIDPNPGRADFETTSHFVVITLSSYVFRIVVLLYFDNNEQLRLFLPAEEAEKTSEHQMSALLSRISEFANVYCGKFKQYLEHSYPFIGMSTPITLEAHCARHIDDQDYHARLHLAGNNSESASFPSSVYLHSLNGVEFTLSPSPVVEETSEAGDLEFL